METSDARKRRTEAELAPANETPEACPWCASDKTHVSFEDPSAYYCGACHHYFRPVPVQPPAPDPDETTFFWDKATGEPCPRSGNVLCALPWTDEHRHTHTPPATTGPADEAEGINWLAALIRLHDGNHDKGAGALAEAIWPDLAARDAAQQRIGAEKALREAADEIRFTEQEHAEWLRDRADWAGGAS